VHNNDEPTRAWIAAKNELLKRDFPSLSIPELVTFQSLADQCRAARDEKEKSRDVRFVTLFETDEDYYKMIHWQMQEEKHSADKNNGKAIPKITVKAHRNATEEALVQSGKKLSEIFDGVPVTAFLPKEGFDLSFYPSLTIDKMRSMIERMRAYKEWQRRRERHPSCPSNFRGGFCYGDDGPFL
jgi:hypothetical protein